MYKTSSRNRNRNNPQSSEERRIERIDSRSQPNWVANKVFACKDCCQPVIFPLVDKAPKCPSCRAESVLVDGSEHFGPWKFSVIRQFLNWVAKDISQKGGMAASARPGLILQLTPESHWKPEDFSVDRGGVLSIHLKQVSTGLEVFKEVPPAIVFSDAEQHRILCKNVMRELEEMVVARKSPRSSATRPISSGRGLGKLGDVLQKPEIGRLPSQNTWSSRSPEQTSTGNPTPEMGSEPPEGELNGACPPPLGPVAERIVRLRDLASRILEIDDLKLQFDNCLSELRDLYKTDPGLFEQIHIDEITALKMKIEGQNSDSG